MRGVRILAIVLILAGLAVLGFVFLRVAQPGIKARAMLMVGNRGDDEESIRATCRFIERARPDTVQAWSTLRGPIRLRSPRRSRVLRTRLT